MPGVSTPALGLPYPSLEEPIAPLNKTIVIYGGSSSTGSMVTQVATNTGLPVVSVVGAKDFDLSKRCGASAVFDQRDVAVVEKVSEAVTKLGGEFVGIFDTISTRSCHTREVRWRPSRMHSFPSG
ncbi:hypothetical protein IFR05_000965 [Cadophora sp. M221]|nr:hypothetical protein IFR05_000965 [Cadophora sp. M221]